VQAGAGEDCFHADLSKIKIDLKDHDISDRNTQGGFDPALVNIKRFTQQG
jgi:hypothetical protein